MVLVCCAYVLLAPAQTHSPGEVRLSSSAYEPKPILRAVSRLVQLEVVVRDSRGRAIPGLTKGDFAVYDSGKIRDLTAFSVDISSPTVGKSSGGGRRPASTSSSLMLPPAAPNLPGQGLANGRWIALLFDDINTASGDLARAKIAASRFIKEAVRGGDSIAIFTISGTGAVQFTSESMAIFAESTGGLLFRNNNGLDLGFRQLGLLPSCIYLLGFTPVVDGKYHKIRVELRSARHDFVQVRPGYFAPQTAPTEEPGPLNKIDALMSGTDEKTDLPATISEKLGTAKSGHPGITIQTHVDIQKLRFEQEKDRLVQKLVFTAALFDSHGNFVTGKQAEMDLALKAENFDRFSKTGISGVMQLEAPAGLYRLRLVVEEAVQGHVSATSKELEVR